MCPLSLPLAGGWIHLQYMPHTCPLLLLALIISCHNLALNQSNEQMVLTMKYAIIQSQLPSYEFPSLTASSFQYILLVLFLIFPHILYLHVSMSLLIYSFSLDLHPSLLYLAKCSHSLRQHPGSLFWSLHCQCKRHGFNPWVGKIPWRSKQQPTPIFQYSCLGNPMGRGGRWAPVHGVAELDTTLWLKQAPLLWWNHVNSLSVLSFFITLQHLCAHLTS